jgi:hypothetical protein
MLPRPLTKLDKKTGTGPTCGAHSRVTAACGPGGPVPQHNIWEYALHAAYWKYVVRRRLIGEKRGSFVLPGSNFFARPVELTEAAWKRDIEILLTMHQDLRSAVLHLPVNQSAATLHMVRGAAAHDIYHAGQIRLLRRQFAG